MSKFLPALSAATVIAKTKLLGVGSAQLLNALAVNELSRNDKAPLPLNPPADKLDDAKLLQNSKMASLIYVSSIVFAYSVLDEFLSDVASLLSEYTPTFTKSFIANKQVAYKDIETKSIEQIESDLIAKWLKDFRALEIERKAELLQNILAPKIAKDRRPEFAIDFSRLKEIRLRRNSYVHDMPITIYSELDLVSTTMAETEFINSIHATIFGLAQCAYNSQELEFII